MELIVISESKLKIMLSAPDMAKYELESARMDCRDIHTREAFRHIFDDARTKIGFDTEGERLFVQLYTSKEGGCEIFVTKLGNNAASFPSEEILNDDMYEEGPPILAVSPQEMSHGEKALLRRIYESEEEANHMETTRAERRLIAGGVRTAALLFERAEDVLTVCRRLLRDGYRGRSTAYIEEVHDKTKWYLLLDIPDVSVYRLPRRFAYLSEYGQRVTSSELFTYLAEYGKLIRKGDAVEVLGQL